MDAVANMTKCSIVFFAAETVPGHDSFSAYGQVKRLMKMPSIIFKEENAWLVVFIVAHTRAVISTSLHACIMAFIFFKSQELLYAWRINISSSSIVEANMERVLKMQLILRRISRIC